MIIHHLLNLECDSTCTLIKDRVLSSALTVGKPYLRTMIEQPGHRYPLFITTRQRISPFPHRVPSTLSLDNMIHIHHFQNLEEIIICHTSSDHVAVGVGIDNLISECTCAEVWSLWDICEFVCCWFVDSSTIDWPKTSENSEQTGFPALMSVLRRRQFCADSHPFGPTTSKCFFSSAQYSTLAAQLTPFSTLNDIDLTSTSPLGLISGTLSNRISSDSIICPRPCNTAHQPRSLVVDITDSWHYHPHPSY